jgi:hypothetical protein
MAYKVADPLKYVGQSPRLNKECHAECAFLAQSLTSMPLTGDWTPGVKVRGNLLPRGTIIAMFIDRIYQNKSGLAHTALYVGQSHEGIEVVHQYRGIDRIKGTLIRFGGGTLKGHKSGVSSNAPKENDADNYYVVESK